MRTREEALNYGLTFPDTYKDAPFHDRNWELVRVHGSKNPDPDNIPCYRVVNSKGGLSGEFAFGGEEEQARLLREDGIEVVDGRGDLKKFGYEGE